MNFSLNSKNPSKPPIPRRDILIVSLVFLQFVGLTLCNGGVLPWAEYIALAFSLPMFFLLLRGQFSNLKESPFHKSSVFQLLKLPLFWTGLSFIFILWIQSWNAEWVMTSQGSGQLRMTKQEVIPWLPRGITTTLENYYNPFRMMVYIAPAWIAVCVLWAGVQSRRAIQGLLHASAIFGCLWGAFAIQQNLSGSKKIIGIWNANASKANSPIPFWGSITNENHAAILLVLLTAVALGLFLSGWVKMVRTHERKGGFFLFYFGFAVITTVSIILARSRGGIAMIVLLWILFIIFGLVFFIRYYRFKGLLFSIIALVGFGVATFVSINNPFIYERIKSDFLLTSKLKDNPELEARSFMLKICNDLIEAKPWFGHGAGSFTFVHLPVLKDYPEFNPGKRSKRYQDPETGKMRWKTVGIWYDRAHVDLHEWIIEFGFLGLIPPLFAIFWMLYSALRAWRFWDYGTAFLLCGPLLVVLSASFEFHLRIPAIFYGTWIITAAILRLPSLKARVAK